MRCLVLFCCVALVAGAQPRQVDLPALLAADVVDDGLTDAIWAERYAGWPDGLRDTVAGVEVLVARLLRAPAERQAALRRDILGSKLTPAQLQQIIRHGWQPPAVAVPTGRFHGTIPVSTGDPIRIDVQVPASYDPRAGKKWPLIVSLHGTAGTGDNYIRHWQMRPPKQLGHYIIVSPTSDRRHGWGPSSHGSEQIWATIASICRLYHVDLGQIYAEGTSMGGIGSRTLAMNRPDQFAAVCQRSGPPYPDPDPRAQGYRHLHNVPLLSYTGGKDHLIPAKAFTDEIAFVKRLGLPATMHHFPDRGHEIFYDKNGDVLAFFASHRRDGFSKKVEIASLSKDPRQRFEWVGITKATSRGNQTRNINVIDITRRNDPFMQKIRAVRHGPTRDKMYDEAMEKGLIVERVPMWYRPLRLRATCDRESNTIRLGDVEFVKEVRLLLDDRLIDPERPLSIRQGARRLKKTAVTPSCETLLDALLETGRREAIWSISLAVTLR